LVFTRKTKFQCRLTFRLCRNYNGSEFTNGPVARILEKLRIEQTKSRSRQSNDNALAESKNGSVVRKRMGYEHIPQQYAKPINEFYQET